MLFALMFRVADALFDLGFPGDNIWRHDPIAAKLADLALLLRYTDGQRANPKELRENWPPRKRDPHSYRPAL